MISEQEAAQIKEQLLQQISNFPEDKREQIKERILSMTDEELEEFVEQNNSHEQKCIFCSIVSGQVPSFKIGEDKDNISILELNPLSKGHTLVIPRTHSNTVPDSTRELAKKVAEKLKILGPKEVKISDNIVMNHAFVEVVPIFGDEKTRKKAKEEDLKSLQELLTKVEEKPKSKPKEEVKEEPKKEPIQKVKPRIP